MVHRISWNEIDEEYIRKIVEIARSEDIDGFGLKSHPSQKRDLTTDTLTPSTLGSAMLVARNEMVLCGLNLIKIILDAYSKADNEKECTVNLIAHDGDKVQKGAEIAEISGDACTIIRAERILLNFIQHLSGIATLTAKYVEALGDSSSKLLDTRKTTPCFRVLEKYAVACGGAYNHRMGLFDRVMLKDNHLEASNSDKSERLAEAVAKAKKDNPNYAIEVEVDSVSQIPFVLKGEPDVIMFDNFSLDELKQGIDLVGNKAWTEASGGITMETIGSIGKVGVDFISSGAMVHQSSWVDIGLDWRKRSL